MKKAIDFINKIKSSDEIVVIFNNDGDGICSCTLLLKLLEKTGKKKPYLISQPMPMDKNILQRIQTTVPNKIIILDIAADQQQNTLKKIASICDVLVVDHHQVFKNMNTSGNASRIVHYNPRMDNPNVYRSTSYCMYRITSKITNMDDCLWIAGVGMVSDYNLDDSKDIVAQLRERYSFEGPLYGTVLGRIADMIAATRATNALSCEQMVHVFESSSLEEFENAKNADKMIESQKIIEKEISDITTDAEENMEHDGNVFFYNIKSKFNLGSTISTKLSENFQKNLVVIYEKSGSRIKVSARNQAKNINAGRVMQKAAKEVGGSGGGHEAAAGATIPANEWDKFKAELIKLSN